MLVLSQISCLKGLITIILSYELEINKFMESVQSFQIPVKCTYFS